MNFIKQIIEGEPEEWVHNMFTRYGRGEFNGPVVELKAGKTLKASASFEYSMFLGYLAASTSSGMYTVDGGIFGKTDYRDGLKEITEEYDDKSKKKYFIAKFKGVEMDARDIARMYECAPGAVCCLSLKPLEKQKNKVKAGKKPPKPGKEEKKENFVKASFEGGLLDKLVGELFFDVDSDFKVAKAVHTYDIKELTIPEGTPPGMERVMARRVGRLVRKLIVDDKEEESEFKLDG